MSQRSKKNRARKVKVLKVEKVEPEKTRVELEIEGGPEIPAVAPPVDPLDFSAPEQEPEKKTWLDWLRGLW
jgi:hypothetical protein